LRDRANTKFYLGLNLVVT